MPMGTEESKDLTLKYFKPNQTVDVVVEDEYTFQPFICGIHLAEEDEKCPYPRSGHKIVCDEANFYSYGGYNPHHPLPPELRAEDDDEEDPNCLFPDVWKYNFALMKWRKLPVKDMPSALASNAVTLSGKLLIVYGGTGVPFHIARSNKLFLCNLGEITPRFQVIETRGQLPPALYGQAIFLRDHYLYAIGGTTGFDYYIDIHRLNLRTEEWEDVYIDKGTRADPPGRYRHELAIVDDKIYILGGGIGREAYDFITVPLYDLKTGTWDSLISVRDPVHGYPSARQYHSVVKIPDTSSFVLAGGLLGSHIFDDAWRLDIPSLQWTKITSLQLATPVYFHASCVTPAGKMYIFGGVCKTSIVDRQERVSHVQSAWICIPKLKEICWEAVIDYGIVNSSHANLEDDDNFLPLDYRKRLIL